MGVDTIKINLSYNYFFSWSVISWSCCSIKHPPMLHPRNMWSSKLLHWLWSWNILPHCTWHCIWYVSMGCSEVSYTCPGDKSWDWRLCADQSGNCRGEDYRHYAWRWEYKLLGTTNWWRVVWHLHWLWCWNPCFPKKQSNKGNSCYCAKRPRKTS